MKCIEFDGSYLTMNYIPQYIYIYIYTYMDRQTKLAYRQRGSRLRRFSNSNGNDGNSEAGAGNTLVIQTPLRLIPTVRNNDNDDDGDNNGTDPVPNFDVDAFEDNQEPLDEEQPELKRQRVEMELATGNQREPEPEENNAIGNDGDNDTDLLSWDYYRELQLDKSQLNSITVIRDLISNLTNNFLLLKAKEQTSLKDTVTNNNNVVSLDTEIFKLFNEGVSTDLKDIRDINEANNIILKQIDTQLRRVKLLNAELASVRARYTDIVQSYVQAGDKGERDREDEDRLELNEQLLNKLTRCILSPSRGSDAGSTTLREKDNPEDDSLYTVSDGSTGIEQLCGLLDPTDGLVAQLKGLQSILRSSEFLSHEK